MNGRENSKKVTTMPMNGMEYRTLNTEIKYKCRLAKEEWLNKMCAVIERVGNTNTESMQNRLKEFTGRKVS